MAVLELLSRGATANDGTGDSAREGGRKINLLIQALMNAGWTTDGPPRPTVRAATTTTLASNAYASGVLTASANGALGAIDGVTLVAGERLLVKDEASGLKNGVYVVTQVGDGSTPYILTRADDFSTWDEIVGRSVYVEEGTANGDRLFFSTADAGGTLGTTSITYALGSVSNVTSAIWGYLAGITSFVGGLFSASNLANFVTALGGARAVCAALSIRHVLASAATAVTHTGDTNETVLATVAIPAGAMGANGKIIVTARGAMSPSSANVKQPRCRLGGIGGTNFGSIAYTTNTNWQCQWLIENRNSQSVQQGTLFGNRTTDMVMTAVAPVAGALDTSGALDLVITGQVANSGESITLDSYLVEILYKA